MDRKLKVVKYNDPVWTPWWTPRGGQLMWGGPLAWQVEIEFWDWDFEGFWLLPLEMEEGLPPVAKRACGPHVRVPEIPLGWDPFTY